MDKKKLEQIIFEACDNKIVIKNPDVELFETGILDSMGFIKLLTEIEDEFDIEINPQDIKKDTFSTPNKIIKYVESLK